MQRLYSSFPKTILIAEDHPVYRNGLVYYLSEELPQTLFSQATDGLEVIQHLSNNECDLILLDLDMPFLGGLEALRILRAMNLPFQPKVIIVTGHLVSSYLWRAISFGANGYALKDHTSREFVEIISLVMNGGTYLEPSICNKEAAHLILPASPIEYCTVTDFTEAEKQLILLDCLSCSVLEISQRLGVSMKTVYRMRQRVSDRVQIPTPEIDRLPWAILNRVISLDQIREFTPKNKIKEYRK